MKEDRRIRRTKSAIKEAFIDLLNEKEIEKITIQDITKRADINRGTFYLHFEDKYLLLDEMENECIAEISNVTEFYNVLGNDAE
ncbi:TetR/AcrR family transcriptional regulator, partial [Staphylococcus sp. HMSC069E09]